MALPATAIAQERKGFWGSFGLGTGSIGVSAEDAVEHNVFVVTLSIKFN
jgi:hypothetical protein